MDCVVEVERARVGLTEAYPPVNVITVVQLKECRIQLMRTTRNQNSIKKNSEQRKRKVGRESRGKREQSGREASKVEQKIGNGTKDMLKSQGGL